MRLAHTPQKSSPLSRYFGASGPRSAVWFQSVGNTQGQVWSGLFRDADVNALSAQVLHEPRRPAAARGPHRGVLLRETTVIDQAPRFQAPQGRFYSLGRVLLLHQFPTQVESRVPPPRQHAQRGPAGGLDVGELPQARQHRRRDLPSQIEPQRRQRVTGE